MGFIKMFSSHYAMYFYCIDPILSSSLCWVLLCSFIPSVSLLFTQMILCTHIKSTNERKHPIFVWVWFVLLNMTIFSCINFPANEILSLFFIAERSVTLFYSFICRWTCRLASQFLKHKTIWKGNRQISYKAKAALSHSGILPYSHSLSPVFEITSIVLLSPPFALMTLFFGCSL